MNCILRIIKRICKTFLRSVFNIFGKAGASVNLDSDVFWQIEADVLCEKRSCFKSEYKKDTIGW